MYKDALKTLNRFFGHPHALVDAYFHKLSKILPSKMHNKESLISCFATIENLCLIWSLLVVAQPSRSIHCITLRPRNTATANKFKKASSMHTVEKNATIRQHLRWMTAKSWSKGTSENGTVLCKTKNRRQQPICRCHENQDRSEFLPVTKSRQTPSMGVGAETPPISFFACREEHPWWSVPQDFVDTRNEIGCRQQTMLLVVE